MTQPDDRATNAAETQANAIRAGLRIQSARIRMILFTIAGLLLSFVISYLIVSSSNESAALLLADHETQTIIALLNEKDSSNFSNFLFEHNARHQRDAEGRRLSRFIRLVADRADIPIYENDPLRFLSLKTEEVAALPGAVASRVRDSASNIYDLIVVYDRPSPFSAPGGRLHFIWLYFLVLFGVALHAHWKVRSLSDEPLRTAIAYADRLANGELIEEPAPPAGTPAIRDLQTALNLIAKRRIAFVEMTRSISEGELTIRDDVELIGAFGDALRVMASNIGRLVSEIRSVGAQVASSSSEILAVSESMETGTRRQAEQSSQVARSAEDIAASVIEIAQNSRNVLDSSREAMVFSEKATLAANKGDDIVQKTVNQMDRLLTSVSDASQSVQELGKLSQDIGQIIETIDDIADQTNMLALNAAIEAARAREHGLGFGVVADEIRRLADQTGEATHRVASLIDNVREHTEQVIYQMNEWSKKVSETTDLSNKAGVSLDDIQKSNKQVQDMVHQIVAATEEQTQASDEMSRNIEAISRSIDAISIVAQESSLGAGEVRHSAIDLTDRTQTLVRKIECIKT